MANMLSRIVTTSLNINTSGTYASGTEVNATPNMSSCIHQFRNTSPIAVDTTVVNLQELRQSYSKSSDAIGRQLYKFTPGIVVIGIGNSGAQAPGVLTSANFRLGKLLRMCSMSQTADSVSSSSLTYAFRSSGFEDGVVDVQLADSVNSAMLYRLKGVYGTFTLAGSAGQVITCDPTLTGVINVQPGLGATKVTSSACFQAAGNTAETMKAEGLSVTTSAGTRTGATAFKFKSFSIDAGIDVQEDSDANAADALGGLIIAGRTPTMQLTVGAESTQVAEMYADLKSGFLQTIVFTHGSSVGKYMTVTAKGQLTNVVMADDVGLRTLQLTYSLAVGATSDDTELTIVFH